MKENEMLYPELGRYPLYWKVIVEKNDVTVNDYFDEELQEEKSNEIRNNPVIMVTQKVIQILQSDKIGLSHGETFEQNIKDLISAYEPDAIFKLCKHTKTGRKEMKFESTIYGGDRCIQALEIRLLGECQDNVFEDLQECNIEQQEENMQNNSQTEQLEQSYLIDHGC